MLRQFPAVDQGINQTCRWVDLVEPSAAEIAQVQQQFGIDVPSLEALQEIEASSRLRVHGDVLYMSAPLLAGTSTDHWSVAPAGFILTPDILVTVRFADLEAFDSVAAAIATEESVLPASIFTCLMEEIVDRSADHLERAAEGINATSQAIFFDEPKRRQLSHDTATLRRAMRKIGQVSDRTSRVRYTFLSIGRMADFVMERCTPKLEEGIRDRLQAVRRDISSLDEFELSLSGRVQLLQDAATGFISIEQNDVVKVLTVVSVVGVPPVLVVGIYGMNFHYMPELSWKFGYPFAIFLCAVSIILPMMWFKWRDWI